MSQSFLIVSLSRQHRLTLEHGIPNAEDLQSRGTLYQQVMELTDLMLDGYVTQLESVRAGSGQESALYQELEHKYLQERRALIMPLSKRGSGTCHQGPM